jgi:hypothetical protein
MSQLIALLSRHEAEFLDEILSSLLSTVTFSLIFLFLQIYATSYRENHTPFPMVKEIHTESLSLRTPKIMPRNINEIVRS